MKKIFPFCLLPVCLLFLCIGNAGATFLVEQYDDFWSLDVDDLINYADNNEASTSAYWDYIDFTDDPLGFAGEIEGSNPWPSAAEAGVTGTANYLNQTFFALITGDFYISDSGTYSFRTYSDDGVFLFVDGVLVIDDGTLHVESVNDVALSLLAGTHSVELYFFENSGEASLEFSIACEDGEYTHFDDVAYQVPTSAPVPEPSTMLLLGSGVVCIMGFARKRFKN